jgi:hypothetical protein
MDSHPVDVCRPIRAGHNKKRLGGLARTGYCAALKRYFHGVREHLIFSPKGYLLHMEQLPGHRHDVQGLYALLRTEFRGTLLGDNAYWPTEEKRQRLQRHGICMLAATRSNWDFQYSPQGQAWLRKHRAPVERLIGLFNQQFHAHRTFCRSLKHYIARRSTKGLAHNCSRHMNTQLKRSRESLSHFRMAI